MEVEAAEEQARRRHRADGDAAEPTTSPPTAAAVVAVQQAQPQQDNEEEMAFQREYWEALKRSLMGAVNKTTSANVLHTAREVLRENVVRGRGLFCRAVLRAQHHSPELTPVLAALVAVVNSKVPAVGNLLVRRLVFAFQRCYKRRDVPAMAAAARFLAHLVTQRVQHELLVLKILVTLLCNGRPTPDDIQVAAAVFKDAYRYMEVSNPAAFSFILEPIRDLVGSKTLDLKSECTLEGLLGAVRRWQDDKETQDVVPRELALVEPEEQTTHAVDLADGVDPENKLDNFAFDPNFEAAEAEYDAFKERVLGPDDEEPALPPPPVEAGEDEDAEEQSQQQQHSAAGGGTERSTTELAARRKAVFLTLKSSVRAEEAAHKLLKDTPPGDEDVVCSMVLEAATRDRSFSPFYGQLASLLCRSNGRYQFLFEQAFATFYAGVDAHESKAIDISAALFAHMLRLGALRWNVMEGVRLTPADTTVSSRRFLRVLLQALGESMTVAGLNEALTNPEDAVFVAGLFPKDTVENARFALNFFAMISETGVDLRPIAARLERWYAQATAPANATKRERDS